MLENAIRAARLDLDLYNTVEHDESYNGQAAAIVVIVSVLGAIGTWGTFRGGFVGTVIGAIIGGLIGWLIWAGLTYFIGTRFFEGQADYGEMLRVTGYAQAPMALTIIPYVGWLAAIWSLVCGFIAVREGLDIDNGKTAITVIIGFVALLVLRGIAGIIF